MTGIDRRVRVEPGYSLALRRLKAYGSDRRSAGPSMVSLGQAYDAQADWAPNCHPEFAKFTLHNLTIAGAEMLMRFAKTGLGLCSADRDGESAAGSACAGLGRFYNL